jgi:DNA/RNA endonuclease G (NUC1)
MKLVVFRYERNLFSVLVGLSVLFSACWRVDASIGTSLQMLLGNPSDATADTNNHDHYLIQRSVEAIDYSDNLREPNWASWDLTAGDIGSSGRSSNFFVDTNLPPNFYRVKTTDYSGSGYDRGHMCPSADRTDNTTDNEMTFYMSNIIPQTPDNNQGVWANLETYCRTLAQSGNELLITCGPSGFDGSRIPAAGLVYVPSNVWKIIVVVPLGSGAVVDRIKNSTRVIAVKIPNISGIRTAPWTNYRTSVNQLQADTGFTFFTALPQDVATVLRAKVDGAPADGITSFWPANGTVDTSVVINGTNFTSASAVTFNGANASFTVNSGSQITATVPGGATSGPIGVIAAGGLATSSNSFTVSFDAPALAIASSGTSVTISWPSPSTGFSLQENADLSATNWTNFAGTVDDNGTNMSVTISPLTGSKYFRLLHP